MLPWSFQTISYAWSNSCKGLACRAKQKESHCISDILRKTPGTEKGTLQGRVTLFSYEIYHELTLKIKMILLSQHEFASTLHFIKSEVPFCLTSLDNHHPCSNLVRQTLPASSTIWHCIFQAPMIISPNAERSQGSESCLQREKGALNIYWYK